MLTCGSPRDFVDVPGKPRGFTASSRFSLNIGVPSENPFRCVVPGNFGESEWVPDIAYSCRTWPLSVARCRRLGQISHLWTVTDRLRPLPMGETSDWPSFDRPCRRRECIHLRSSLSKSRHGGSLETGTSSFAYRVYRQGFRTSPLFALSHFCLVQIRHVRWTTVLPVIAARSGRFRSISLDFSSPGVT